MSEMPLTAALNCSSCVCRYLAVVDRLLWFISTRIVCRFSPLVRSVVAKLWRWKGMGTGPPSLYLTDRLKAGQQTQMATWRTTRCARTEFKDSTCPGATGCRAGA